MTPRRASELILAADFSCTGSFSAVGAMCEPSLALSVAVRDLGVYRENAELKPVVVHVLATRIAGRCTIASARTRRALQDCLTARIVLEWKITVPTIGYLRALFLVTRLGKTNDPELVDLVLQLASKPCFEDMQERDVVEPQRRACALLRFF